MAQRGGRPRNQTIDDNFKDFIDETKREPQHRCIHCNYTASKHVDRGLQHLTKCEEYMKHKQNKSDDTKPSTDLKQLSIVSSVRPLSQIQILHANRTAAMAVYMTNLPFNHYENDYILLYQQALHPGYKPPNRKAIAGPLLEDAYQNVKKKVHDQLDVCAYLNFFTDETANIRKEKLINLCCHAPQSSTSTGGGFHIKAETGIARIMTAKVQAEWVVKGCKEATNNQLWRINYIGTDTCSTMRSMWEEISKIPETSHVFTVPCDSHSLQLLMGDILKRPFFDDIIQKCQTIVTAFRASHKELAILWEFQMRVSVL